MAEPTDTFQAYRLDFPPSLNNAFVNTPTGRIKSADYNAWRVAAGYQLRRQRPVPIVGRFKAELTFDRPDNRRRDLDNLCKPVLDLLVECGVVVDDSLAEDIRLRWSGMPARKPGGVLVVPEGVE